MSFVTNSIFNPQFPLNFQNLCGPFPPVIWVSPGIAGSFAPVPEFATSVHDPTWYDLVSILRDESGLTTAAIYFPSLGYFYDVRGGTVTRLDSAMPPVMTAIEQYLGALYIRRDLVDLFRIYLPSLSFVPRFSRVMRYSFTGDTLNRSEIRTEALERARGHLFFSFDPTDSPFPALPLCSICGRSVLDLPSSPQAVQLVWVQLRGTDRFVPKPLPLTAPEMPAGDIVRLISADRRTNEPAERDERLSIQIGRI
jgi:hypothetical protein